MFTVGRRVYGHVVIRIAKFVIQSSEYVMLQYGGHFRYHLVADRTEPALRLTRDQPYFQRYSRGKRAKRYKMLVYRDEPAFFVQLGGDNLVEYAAMAVCIIVAAVLQLTGQSRRYDIRADKLKMRVQ